MGELPLKLHLPARFLGFASTLRLRLYKTKEVRVTLFAEFAGHRRKLDFKADQQWENRTIEEQWQSLMYWKPRRDWQQAPPYQVAIQLFLEHHSKDANALIFVESLAIQALAA